MRKDYRSTRPFRLETRCHPVWPFAGGYHSAPGRCDTVLVGHRRETSSRHPLASMPVARVRRGHGSSRRDTVHRPNRFLMYQNLDHRHCFIACDRFPKVGIRTYFDECYSGQSIPGLIRSSYISGWYITGRYPPTRVHHVNHECRRCDARPWQTPACTSKSGGCHPDSEKRNPITTVLQKDHKATHRSPRGQPPHHGRGDRDDPAPDTGPGAGSPQSSSSWCAAGAAIPRRHCPAPTPRSCGPRRTPFTGARGRMSGPRPRGARRRAAIRRRDCSAPTRSSCGPRRTPFAGAHGRTSGARLRGARGRAATRRRDCPAPTRRSGGVRRTHFIGARGRTSGLCARGARPPGASRGGHPVWPGRQDGAVWVLAGGGALCAVHPPPPFFDAPP